MVSKGSHSSRAAMLAALVLLVTFAWVFFVFSIGRCCPPDQEPQQEQQQQQQEEEEEGFYSQHWIDTKISSWNDTAGGRTSPSPNQVSLDSIVFGIAGSSELWGRRKEFIRLWWRPNKMRGFVFLEERSGEQEDDGDAGLPSIKISETTHNIRDSIRGAALNHPTGVRISRIVSEMFKMGLPGVKWFVLCDDDTVFSIDNLLGVLSKYDPEQLYYIGSTSESHQQNVAFSYDMAFGGAGFALSYPLAQNLAGMQDGCLQHYPELMGSDDRLRACISELGVPLTREIGFHQCDVRGDPRGLLAAHPIAPFVSMHHVEVMEPLFPNLDTLQGLRMLAKAMQIDGTNFLQQGICYDASHGGSTLTFSVSSGYLVQVFPAMVYPRVLEKAELTFTAWNRKQHTREFDLDSRQPFWICKQPFLYYLDDIGLEQADGSIVSFYKRYTSRDRRKMMCWSRATLPEKIKVVSRPLGADWYKAPRRQCCQVGQWEDGGEAQITMSSCGADQNLVHSS